MIKRYYVYIDNAIVGYVDASAYDNDHALCRGAMQKSRDVFGSRVDVVECGFRKTNVSFERVTDTVFKRVGYEGVVVTSQSGKRERVVRGYDVITNTFR